MTIIVETANLLCLNDIRDDRRQKKYLDMSYWGSGCGVSCDCVTEVHWRGWAGVFMWPVLLMITHICSVLW